MAEKCFKEIFVIVWKGCHDKDDLSHFLSGDSSVSLVSFKQLAGVNKFKNTRPSSSVS